MGAWHRLCLVEDGPYRAARWSGWAQCFYGILVLLETVRPVEQTEFIAKDPDADSNSDTVIWWLIQ